MLETENSNLRAQLYQLQRENALLRMPKPTPPLVPGAKPSVVELLQTWPDQAWIQAVGDSVVGLPRLREEILPQLHGTNNGKGCILFHLFKNPKAKASAILQHALNSVLDLSKKHPAVFKIGITSNPIEKMDTFQVWICSGQARKLAGHEGHSCVRHISPCSYGGEFS